MIAFVRGSVVSIGSENLVVDIGPMGVSVSVTPATALAVRIGENIQLITSMVIREDSWTPTRSRFSSSFRPSMASDRELPWPSWLL